MRLSRKIFFLITVLTLLFCSLAVRAQEKLTYPEISTALQAKVPNQSFKTKADIIKFLIDTVRSRKVDKPLTKDREADLRQGGATDELIDAIKANSPPPPKEDPIVDLGELATRAKNLVKPDYTSEARQAGINGNVTLELSLDEQGKVISTRTISGLSKGLTEQAIAAAKASTFSPAILNGKPAKGVGTITYNFKINVVDINATLALADGYRNRASCAAAIAEYTKVLSADASQVKALFGRGVCNVMTKNYDAAINDLEGAVKLVPADDQALYYLGIAYDFFGRPREAAAHYEQAINANPSLGKWVLSDCVFIDRRQVPKDELRAFGDGVVKACTTSLQQATVDFLAPLIYLKRGIGFRLKGDFEHSIADLENAQRLSPRFGAVQAQLQITYSARGEAHFDRKEFKEAISDITAAININPQNPTPFVNRCAIYLYGMKDYDQAISDCSAAIRLTPRTATAYAHRGYAYEMKKDLKNAVADYNKALEIDPQNQIARTNLARVQGPSIKN
jgi:TonB family protein